MVYVEAWYPALCGSGRLSAENIVEVLPVRGNFCAGNHCAGATPVGGRRDARDAGIFGECVIPGIIHNNYHYVSRRINFQSARRRKES